MILSWKRMLVSNPWAMESLSTFLAPLERIRALTGHHWNLLPWTLRLLFVEDHTPSAVIFSTNCAETLREGHEKPWSVSWYVGGTSIYTVRVKTPGNVLSKPRISSYVMRCDVWYHPTAPTCLCFEIFPCWAQGHRLLAKEICSEKADIFSYVLAFIRWP